MKEIEDALNLLFPDQELSIVKRQEVEYMLDEVVRPHPNHPTYEVDLIDEVIRIAQVENIDTVNFLNWKEAIKEQKIIKNPHCIYLTALNINNCRKKLKKISEKISKFSFENEEKVLSLHKNRKVQFLTGKN